MFVVIGSVTADLFVRSGIPLSKVDGDGFRSSNLIFTDSPLTITMGGNGGNSAYVLAGLGVPTALCGAVGADLLGEALVDWLQSRNVDLRGLTRSSSRATSSSTIIMRDAANQVVFHHAGCTAEVDFQTMPDEIFAAADGLLVSSFPLLPRMRAGGAALALARVHAAGGVTALDVGPAIGDPVTLADLAPLLPTVDYLIANTHEVRLVTGAADWCSGAKRVLAAGARHVVVKRGEHGASVLTPTERIDVPGFRVEAKTSVGAGDAFNSGFLYGLRQGWSLPRTLRFGNAVAALVVSRQRGVLDSPELVQIEAFLDAQPDAGL